MPRIPRDDARLVTTARALRIDGVTRRDRVAALSSGRWQRAGLAIVLHNGPLSVGQQREVARIHGGPAAVLSAFTALERHGLTGWERREIHLLSPPGNRLRPGSPIPTVLHLSARPIPQLPGHPDVHDLVDALVLAASTFTGPRPACAILAAAVQQRLVNAESVRAGVVAARRVRHRHAMLAALADIAGGAHALSEIDFALLCRRHGLPEPLRQTVRVDSTGRRRYLDATWRRADGRLVVVEVDGALHLQVARWWDDQLRQNELSLADALVLRFPAVVVRAEEREVVRQLRRALTTTP